MDLALDSRDLIRATSVNRVLEIIGDRWVLLILQQCFLGVQGFETFQRRLDIPRSTLSNRLGRLVDHGLLTRSVSSTPNQRLDYRLTQQGRDLFDTALMALAWQQQWVPRFSQPALRWRATGQPITPTLICAHCKKPVHAREVRYRDGPGASWITRDKQRRRRSTVTTRPKQSLAVSQRLLDLLGDRWTPQVVALGFFGIRRFDDMQKTLKLASNILTDRLKRVVEMGIYEQRLYQTRPPRSEYRLTERGLALYPMLVCMTQWGDRWCAGPEGPPLLLTHTLCGQPLRGVVVCERTGERLTPATTEPMV